MKTFTPTDHKKYKFIDDIGTTFTKGPFVIESEVYDYKLKDKDGVDYCTEDQMKSWGVKIAEVLQEA